jgi:hypothetical protein
MSYPPNNVPVYNAAFDGAIAGFYGAQFNNPSYYAELADVWAQAIDIAWGSGGFTSIEISMLTTCSIVRWMSQPPQEDGLVFVSSAYAAAAAQIVSLVRAGNAQVVSEGIDPNATGGGSVPLSAAWVPVNHAESPYATGTGRKFLVDATAGPVQLSFAGITFSNNDIVIVSDEFAQGSINPITFVPPAGVGMDDPSTPGTYRTNTGQLAAMTGATTCVWWQYIASLNKLVAIVGV